MVLSARLHKIASTGSTPVSKKRRAPLDTVDETRVEQPTDLVDCFIRPLGSRASRARVHRAPSRPRTFLIFLHGPGKASGCIPPRRDRATRRDRNDRAPSPVRELFFERRPAHRVGGASRVSVPRSMLGWLLGGRATKEERRTAAIRCATRDSALKQCVVANSKETCDRLAQDLDLCKVRLVGNVRCRYRTRARARARPTRASRRRRVAPAGLPIVGTPSFQKSARSCHLRVLVPTARSSKLAVFPPRDSTGKGGVSRRGRRLLPLRAPRRQPHRQAGRRPRLLETVEKDARVPSTRAGLT